MATVIIGILLFAALAAVAFYIYKRHKKGTMCSNTYCSGCRHEKNCVHKLNDKKSNQ
ncbi:MAG: FeoB-associated Cys-rich membrane protein [Bacillota bacterium]|jgi:hypothetical protein